MNSLKKITNPEKYRSFIYSFILFSFMSNLFAIGSENKSVPNKSKISVNEFEELFFKDSISYSEYDNSESQLKIFFGRLKDNNLSEEIFYPDLSIIYNSDLLRKIYKSKLNDMAIN